MQEEIRKIDGWQRELESIGTAITSANRALSAETRNPKWSAKRIQALKEQLAELKKRKGVLNEQIAKAIKRRNTFFRTKNRKSNRASWNSRKGVTRKTRIRF